MSKYGSDIVNSDRQSQPEVGLYVGTVLPLSQQRHVVWFTGNELE